MRLAVVAIAAVAAASGLAVDHDTEFLVASAAQEGVVSLPSGLQYKVLKSGPADGPKPALNANCVVHYTGTYVTMHMLVRPLTHSPHLHTCIHPHPLALCLACSRPRFLSFFYVRSFALLFS